MPSARPFGRSLSAMLLALCAVVASACNSPTLPLPPPSTPGAEKVDDTHVKLSSEHGVEANAIVIIYNHNPNVSLSDRVEGAQADDGGSWSKVIVAKPGDVIDISQQFGTTNSSTTTFEIPALK